MNDNREKINGQNWMWDKKEIIFDQPYNDFKIML